MLVAGVLPEMNHNLLFDEITRLTGAIRISLLRDLAQRLPKMRFSFLSHVALVHENEYNA